MVKAVRKVAQGAARDEGKTITDIAAKVVASPVPVHQPTFTSLVRTSKNIPAAGKHSKKK